MEQTLLIAGVACRLGGMATPFHTLVARSLAPFLTGSASPDFSLELTPHGQRLNGGDAGRLTFCEETLTLEGSVFEGRYDRRRGSGWLRPPPALRILHRFVSAAYAVELPSRAGRLVHSAGGAPDGG